MPSRWDGVSLVILSTNMLSLWNNVYWLEIFDGIKTIKSVAKCNRVQWNHNFNILTAPSI